MKNKFIRLLCSAAILVLLGLVLANAVQKQHKPVELTEQTVPAAETNRYAVINGFNITK